MSTSPAAHPAPAAPSCARARVLENRPRAADLRELALLAPAGWGPALAGQFVQLACPPHELFGLPRPFSLADCRPHPEGVELRVLYGVVGGRTRALAGVAPGEELELVGPLGTPFAPRPGRRPVMLGGGRGLAPVLMLARQWCGGAERAGLLLHGARTSGLLLPLDAPPCELLTATDDGTAGFAGTLLDLLDALLRNGRVREGEDALFACGPNRMLAALSRWAQGRDLPCQVSLETHFGCGFGICAGCAVPVRAQPPGEDAAAVPGDAFGRFVFACREGPVFESWRVEWEGVHE